MEANKKNHVLVLAYYFPPMGLSGVQRIAKLVKYLPEKGWKVTVVTPEPGAYFAFDHHLWDELQGIADLHIVRTQSLDPTRIGSGSGPQTVSFPKESSRKWLSYLSQFVFLPDNKIGWKKHALKAARAVMKSDPCSVIYATGPPYTAFLAGRDLANEFSIPLVLDYRDDWVDNPRHRYPTPWHRKRMTTLESTVLAVTTHVYAINETILGAISSRAPAAETTFSVLPQGYDPADFSSNDQAKDEPRDPSVMTFLYTGMFYDAQQPDAFLRALNALFSIRPELRSRIRAQFLGLFPDSGLALVQDLGLTDAVDLKGYKSHDESIQALMRCDVAWMIVGRQPGEEMISTGKLFEYMGSGKPILALVPDGEAKKALQGYEAFVSVDPDNIDQIRDAIINYYDLWETKKLPASSPHHVAQFDRKNQAGTVADLLKKSVKSNS